MTEQQSFNLTDFSNLSFANFKVISWLFLGGAILLLVVFMASIYYNLERGTLWGNVSATYGITYVGLPAVAALMFFGTWKAGSHGAVEVVILDDALRFRWISGKVDTLKWSAPTFSLVLIDRTSSGYARYTPLHWEARRWNRPKTDLTKEAYLAIVEAAENHAMVLERKIPNRFGWGVCEMVRISAPSKSA